MEVKEWDTTIYFYEKPMTRDAIAILKYLNQSTQQFDMEGLVEVIMRCALTEEGKKLFYNPHRDTLMNKTEFPVLLNIVNEMKILDHIIGGGVEEVGKE